MSNFIPKRAILHCSSTPDYPADNRAFDLLGAPDIDVWHKQRGWAGIGYHFVIRQSGILEFGRPLDKMGSHVKGENSDSFGICYIGTRRINDAQLKTLSDLYLTLKKSHSISWENWFCHYEFSTKECPGLPKALLIAYLKTLG